MRKIIVLLAIAILALGASPALAINATFTVTGHFGVTTTTSKCTTLDYPKKCPSVNCVCYTATKTSLHTATGGLLTIPPGTTKVAVSVDNTLNTSHPGCKPAWGEIQYTEIGGGPDTATIEFFASLCSPLFAASPLTFSGGGALTSSNILIGGFPFDITGFGTATGTYSPANTGTNLTLSLTAVVPVP